MGSEFHQVMNFSHCCDILVLFSAAGSHCFKKILVDLKGKEGAQTNKLVVFLQKNKGAMLSPSCFIQVSGSWPLLWCVLAPKVTVTAGSLCQ